MQAVIDDELSRTLVARAADGDELAFARIVAAYHHDSQRAAAMLR